MSKIEELEAKRLEVLGQFPTLRDFRRGTLLKRYLACGKGDCHCTKPNDPGHGPKYSLTYKEEAKTQTEYIPQEQAEQVSQQLKEHKRFLELCRQLMQLNEQICLLRLQEGKKKLRRNRRATERSER